MKKWNFKSCFVNLFISSFYKYILVLEYVIASLTVAYHIPNILDNWFCNKTSTKNTLLHNICGHLNLGFSTKDLNKQFEQMHLYKARWMQCFSRTDQTIPNLSLWSVYWTGYALEYNKILFHENEACFRHLKRSINLCHLEF